MSSPYPVLGEKPIDQWRVTELKEELKKRKLTTKGLKDDLIKRLDEALRAEMEEKCGNEMDTDNQEFATPGDGNLERLWKGTVDSHGHLLIKKCMMD